MDIKKVNLAYFSPTQSTKKIIQGIATGLALPCYSIHHSLTNVSDRKKEHVFGSDELLIVGVPSYGGRIPQVEPGLFDHFKGTNTPVVLVVVYGNRGYEDVLLEMDSILSEKGFFSIAAAAFVAQHAASPKIATGRPNAFDMKKATEFGQLVGEKLNKPDEELNAPAMPGNFPFKPLNPSPPIAPITNDKCIYCMLCFRWCPTDAIADYSPNTTDASKCIKCQGCVRRCPMNAREIQDETFRQRVLALEGMCAENDFQPEFFL